MLPPEMMSEVLMPYTSRVATRAFSSMNSRRGSTLSPMSIVKRRSATAASSIRTCASVRVSGSIVVSRSWSAFISPNPLNRCSPMPFCATPITDRRGVLRVAEPDVERRRARQLDQRRVHAHERAVLVGGKQRARDRVRARQAAARLGRLDDDLLVVAGDDL